MLRVNPYGSEHSNPASFHREPAKRTSVTSDLFTSARERWLWILTGFVVATVLATLGVAGTWAGGLGNSDLNALTFVLGFVLVVVAIATQGVDRSIGRTEVFALVGVIAVYVLVVTRLTSFAERSHLIEYGVVALLIHAALVERSKKDRRVTRPALVAIAFTALLGTVDELIQPWLPQRVFDPVDILFNATAAIMSVTAAVWLARTRARRSRVHGSHRG